MQLRKIQYRSTLHLRQRLLRPNSHTEECVLLGDTDDHTQHYGYYKEASIVGVVSIYRRPNPKCWKGIGYQIRAMAVSEMHQGEGIGMQLLTAAEKDAFDQDADYIWANARVSARGFYQKAGYQTDGNTFNIEGIGPHVLVFKARPIE